jgi:hypothetical protein
MVGGVNYVTLIGNMPYANMGEPRSRRNSGTETKRKELIGLFRPWTTIARKSKGQRLYTCMHISVLGQQVLRIGADTVDAVRGGTVLKYRRPDSHTQGLHNLPR